ncbi:MAG: hypothetical protein ACYDEN_15100, partial [Acidimicrobiales bacterium]
LGGFGLWLATRHPAAVAVVARGRQAADRRLPALLRRRVMAATWGVAGAGGAALAGRGSSGELRAHGFGREAPALAESVVAAARAWEVARRPLLEEARIEAWVGPAASPPAADRSEGSPTVQVHLGHAVVRLRWDG